MNRPYVAYLGGLRPRQFAVLEVRDGRARVLSRHFTVQAAHRKLHQIRRNRRMTA